MPALATCILVLIGWFLVHTRYLLPLWPKPRSISDLAGGGGGSDKPTKMAPKGSSSSNGSESIPMMNLLSTDMLTDMDDSGDEEDDEHERLLSHRPPPHSDPSSILDRPMLRALHSRLLPELLREDYGWKLVYSLINDGASLHTLMVGSTYRHAE